MTTIFENVGIIGLGLMGSSLARAIKKNDLAKKITAYTRTADDLKKALQLGIIDKIASSNTEIANNCDIIIICTPLSAYEDIFREIAPVILEKKCIISDVGSLKLPVINLAEKYLAPKNLEYFIPAHPIAGTEKTGVESGFAELFENKRTILTPNVKNNRHAVEIIEKLWEICGSQVQILEASKHDEIYAEVSHLPQFLAYCYAMLLLKNSNFINKNNDIKNNHDFWKFSRICASDPKIWYDIFSMNIKNLETCLNNFIIAVQGITSNNKSFKLIKDSSKPENISNILANIIPAIISSSLINCSPNAEYAGSGFKDLTSFLNYSCQITDKSNELAGKLLLNAQELMSLIKNGDYKNSMEFMQNSVNWYVHLKNDTEAVSITN